MKTPRSTSDTGEEDGETIAVCPECDDPKIEPRVSSDIAGRPASTDKNYSCTKCPATFDEPDRRKRYSHDTHTPRSILKRLDVPEEHLPPEPESPEDDSSTQPKSNAKTAHHAERSDVDNDTETDESGERSTDRPSIKELDQRRVEYGLSQRELSRRAGFEEGRFNDILTKGLTPTDETVDALVDVFEQTEPLSADDLSSKRGPKPQPSQTLSTEQDGNATVGNTPTDERST